MSRRLRKILLPPAALLIFGVIAALILLWPRDPYVSDPTMPRPSDRHDRKASASPEECRAFLERVRVDNKAECVTLTYPEPAPGGPIGSEVPNLDLHLGETVSLPEGGHLTFSAIGTAVMQDPEEHQESGSPMDKARASFRFWGRDGRVLSEAEISAFPDRFRTHSGARLTGIQPLLTLDGCENLRIINSELIDSQTGYRYTDGSGSSFVTAHALQLELSRDILHQTPMIIEIELAYGRLRTYDLPASAGSTIELPDGLVMFASLIPRVHTTDSFMGSKGFLRLTYDWSRLAPEGGSRVLVVCSPRSLPKTTSYRFVDGSGCVHSSTDSTFSLPVLDFRLPEMNPADIKFVRVTRKPHLARLRLRLKELPGLPEQNRGIDSLFDQHVPYCVCKSVDKLHEKIATLTQLQLITISPSGTPTYPKDFFPITFKDATVRDLMIAYESGYPRHTLTPDPKRPSILKVTFPVSSQKSWLAQKIDHWLGR